MSTSGRNLYGGVAVVTGAASGIGRQCARSFAAEGCSRIALMDRDEEGLSETARQCKSQSPTVKTFIIPFDVRNEQEVISAMDCVIEEWGRIDYAVNSAGFFGGRAPSHLTSTEKFDTITNTNYRGLWLCSRAQITQMMKQQPLPTHDGRPGNRGSIVNIASQLGLVARPETPAYNASKAAIIQMTKSDAVDYSKYSIRVNCVCPGIIDTPMSQDIPEDDHHVLIAPMKRKGTAQEVADAALFLCSSKATFVQGATLVVDGGYTIV